MIALNTYHALSVGTSTISIAVVSSFIDCSNAFHLGAFLVGDLDAAEELFNHARYQLGGVFDATNYDVANALCGIAFWYIKTQSTSCGIGAYLQICSRHRFACTSRKQLDERTIYYLNQSLQICRNLKDTNNDIYLTAMRYRLFAEVKLRLAIDTAYAESGVILWVFLMIG